MTSKKANKKQAEETKSSTAVTKGAKKLSGKEMKTVKGGALNAYLTLKGQKQG